MRIEILSIGEELLQGKIVNSNAAYLSERLWKMGYPVHAHHVCKDSKDSLEEIKEIFHKTDFTIVTGGLGPTLDDLTRGILCELFQTKLSFTKELYEDLRKRYPLILEEEVKEAAMQPEGASLFYNHVGSAPALLFEKDNKYLCAMPGVPEEIKELCEKQFFPWLKKKFPPFTTKFSFSYYLAHQIEPDVDLILRKIAEENPKVQVGIYPDIPNLAIIFSVDAADQKEAEQSVEKAQKSLYEKLGESIYSLTDQRIEKALHDLFTTEKKKIATAESCTGGALATRFTALANCSTYFLGSIVAYSNAWKEHFLQVDSKLIAQKGVVNEETVAEMTSHLLDLTEADFALATSGIAGPKGGTKDKPVGTVYLSIQERGKKPFTGKIKAPGSREFVVAYTTTYLLSSLWEWIKHKKPPKFQ